LIDIIAPFEVRQSLLGGCLLRRLLGWTATSSDNLSINFYDGDEYGRMLWTLNALKAIDRPLAT
jgi:hypothetical protein